jgi:SAM-dependent methyltransferase
MASLLPGTLAIFGVEDRFMPVIRFALDRLNSLSRRLSTAVFSREATVKDVAHLDVKSKFTKVYKDNIFGGSESRSGEGSNLVQTRVIREEISKLLVELEIGTLLDAPCGDWNWMRATKLGSTNYVGVDIVPLLIEKNIAQFSSESVQFACVDIMNEELPKADLILSRDCLVHLSFEDAFKVLRNFRRSGAIYLLTTTFTDRTSNDDLGTRFWRPLNKQILPFNFPAPLKIINECCTEGGGAFSDKSLGLWALKDIPLE